MIMISGCLGRALRNSEAVVRKTELQVTCMQVVLRGVLDYVEVRPNQRLLDGSWHEIIDHRVATQIRRTHTPAVTETAR